MSAGAGLTPAEVFEACRAELRSQQALVTRLVEDQLRPALRDLGTPTLDAGDLTGQGGQVLARVQGEGLDASVARPLCELGACGFARRPAWG